MDLAILTTATLICLATLVASWGLLRRLYRDVYTIFVSLRLVSNVRRICSEEKLVIDLFEDVVSQTPKKTFIVFHEDRYSYAQVEDQANRVARALISLGFGLGDTLALVMSNEPAFIWIYLGVLKVGGRVAVVNHHLMAEALRHSLRSCSPNIVLVGDGLEEDLPARVAALSPDLDVPVFTYNPASSLACSRTEEDFPCFSSLMMRTPCESVCPSIRFGIKLSDPAAFIFTSGTTGLPKPAIITHKKMIICSQNYVAVGFSSKEVMYVTLPLYHASALNLAVLNVISAGATVVLREKFSASQFWLDCVNHQVTCFQYIGEMLRYLVNSRPVPEESQHQVWAAVGNGLRADIWGPFKSRFKVKQIYEFYGATEMPSTAINMFNVPGSVGRLSPLLSRLMNCILVKLDTETGSLYRNQDGRCEKIGPGSYGVMLVKLTNRVQFDGYLGPSDQTKKRIEQDVLEPGDWYINTSDLFSLDSEYNLFFKDRIGDSYRWKGENVSTAEVSNVMNAASFVQDTNVFGVTVPGYEGRTGMAAISLRENQEVDSEKLEELSALCRSKLPGYARPRFLRFQRQMSLSSTFKQQKSELVREGFDTQLVRDPLFYLDRTKDQFKPLDQTAHGKIIRGEIAL